MGVIKKNDAKLGVFSADSEESLHINQYSEDDNVSTASENTTAVTSTHQNRSRLVPIPMSFSSGRKLIGRRRFRHFENGHQLETLVEGEELKPVTIYDFIPGGCVGFSRVVASEDACELWENFINSSEEVQHQIIDNKKIIQPKKLIPCGLPETPEAAFRNIKTGLRNILKKPHVPLGMIEYLESTVVEFFTTTPSDIFISEQLSSYERLLLHAVAQYYCLKSLSFDSKTDNIRLVKVSNPHNWFNQPSMLLVQFLDVRKSKILIH